MWKALQRKVLWMSGRLWALLLTLLVGCSQGGPPVAVNTLEQQADFPGQEYLLPPPRYLLGPGDLLRVTYLGENLLDSNVKVAPDGRLLLPLVDEGILASGLTLDELQSRLAEKLSLYLVDPQAFVHLLELGSQHVFVLGEVRNPQLAQSEPLTLAGVIAACGGLTRDGQKKQIIVIRRIPGQDPVVFEVNFNALLKGKSLLPDLPLQRYDIVIVPKSRVANLRDFMGAVFGNNLSMLRFGIDAVVLSNALQDNLELYYQK